MVTLYIIMFTMKKLIIAVLIVGILCTIEFCGPYYVVSDRDLVDKVHVGDKFLYSHNWGSANPFDRPVVHKVLVVDIKKRQHTEWVLYQIDGRVFYSSNMKNFKKNIRRLDYKYKK